MTELDNNPDALPTSAQQPERAGFVPSPKALRIIMGHIRTSLAGEFRYEDIWPFVKDLLENGEVIGLIEGRHIDPISLASQCNYNALRRGDDMRLPVIALHTPSSGHLGREIEAWCEGPVYFELAQLNRALDKSKPAFVDDGEYADEANEMASADEASSNDSDRAGKGGRIKMPLRVAISMASYYICKEPTADFDKIFERVREFWANTNEKSSVDTAYLKYMLRPVYQISRAEFEDVRFSEIEKMAGAYAAEDLKKNEDRRVGNGRAKAPRAKRQAGTDQHE